MRMLKRAWRAFSELVSAEVGTLAARRMLIGAGNVAWHHPLRCCRWLAQCRRERLREYYRQRKEVAWRARRARRRALVLLLRQLNPEQRQEFRLHRHFHLLGGISGTRYRIRHELIANIDVLDRDNTVTHRLCIHLIDVPLYDMMAAQLLHLQDPEMERPFLQLANIHPPILKSPLNLRDMWVP